MQWSRMVHRMVTFMTGTNWCNAIRRVAGKPHQAGCWQSHQGLRFKDFLGRWALQITTQLHRHASHTCRNCRWLNDIKCINMIWVRVKIQGMDQGPEPTHDPYPPIHTLIHTLWYCMIHTLDPYPWSIPLIHTPDPYPFLIEERLMLALMLFF